MSLEKKKILICYDPKDAQEIGALECQLGEFNCKFVTLRIESTSNCDDILLEEDLVEAIDEVIDQAHICVAFVSENAFDSKFLDRQLQVAHEKEKRIVGVWANDSMEPKIPRVLSEYGDGMYTMTDEGFRDILDFWNRDWRQPDGKDYPKRKIKHHPC